MKLLSKIYVFAFILSIITGVTTATSGDLWDWIDNLNGEIPFGYMVSQKIAVSQITIDKIVIHSPVIQDDLGNKIKKYTVMFSQYPLSKILEDVSLLSQSKEKTFDFTAPGTGITIELNALADNITPSVVTYLSIIPKDDNGILGEISNEIRFRLDTKTYGEGEPSASSTVHGAPGANMSLANVTHTITQNKATLRWTAVDGSSMVDIFLRNPTSGIFERLTGASMTAETYTFTLTRNGEYIVNFVPNNGGTEHRYTFVANGIVAPTGGTPPVKPIIGKIPATGPKENILIVFGIALVAYFVYRKMRAKH